MGQNESSAKELLSQGERRQNVDLKPGVSANIQVPSSTDENINLQKYPSTYGKSLQNKNNKYFADNSSVAAEHRRMNSDKENLRINENGKHNQEQQFLFRNESNKENVMYQARANEKNQPARSHQIFPNNPQGNSVVQTKKIKEYCTGATTNMQKVQESNYFTLGDESAHAQNDSENAPRTESNIQAYVKESLFAIKTSLNKTPNQTDSRGEFREKEDPYKPQSTFAFQGGNQREGHKIQQNQFQNYFQSRVENKLAANYCDQRDKFLENLKFSPKMKCPMAEKQTNPPSKNEPMGSLPRANLAEERTFEAAHYAGPLIDNEYKRMILDNESRKVSLSYISIESCNNPSNNQGKLELDDDFEFMENRRMRDILMANLDNPVASFRQNQEQRTENQSTIQIPLGNKIRREADSKDNLRAEPLIMHNQGLRVEQEGTTSWKNTSKLASTLNKPSYLTNELVSKTFAHQEEPRKTRNEAFPIRENQQRSKSRSKSRAQHMQAKSIKSIADYGGNNLRKASTNKRSTSKAKQMNKTESEIMNMRMRSNDSDSELFDSDNEEQVSAIPFSNYHANKKPFSNYHEDSLWLQSKSVMHNYDGDSEDDEILNSRKKSNIDCKKKPARSKSRNKKGSSHLKNESMTHQELPKERSTSNIRSRVSSHKEDIRKKSPVLPGTDKISGQNKGPSKADHGHHPQQSNPMTYPFVINSPYMQSSPYEPAGQGNFYMHNQNQTTVLNSPLSTMPSPVQNLHSIQSPMNNYSMGLNPYQNMQGPQLEIFNAHQQAMLLNYHMMSNQIGSPHYYMGPPQVFPSYMVNGMGQNNALKGHYPAFMPNSPPPIIINNNLVNPETKVQNNSLVNDCEKQSENLNETKRNLKVQENCGDNFSNSRRQREKTDFKEIDLGPLNEADLQSDSKSKRFGEPLALNRLSLKDEAVIMASPDINSNLMILKGCRNNDLSYRAAVNTTAVNFEISGEKSKHIENSEAQSKRLSKRSLEFEKFSNHSSEEAQLIFSSNKACRVVNQSLISPSCEINSPMNNKSNKNSEKDLGNKLEVTEFIECHPSGKPLETPQNSEYAIRREQPLTDHQKKVFSFKFGPTGKKTSWGEARYEDVQNFMSQESFSQRDTLKHDNSLQATGFRNINSSYEGNPSANLEKAASPIWKGNKEMSSTSTNAEERRIYTQNSNECFEKTVPGNFADKAPKRGKINESESYETSNSARRIAGENFTTGVTETSLSSLRLESKKALKMEFNFGFGQAEAGNKETKTLADFFNEKKKTQMEKRNFSKKKDVVSCDQNSIVHNLTKNKENQSISSCSNNNELSFTRHTVSAISHTQNIVQPKKLSKEELLRNRREMIEYGRSLKKQVLGEEELATNTGKRMSHFDIKDINLSRGGSVSSLKKKEPDPALIERLANGVKTKLTKKEMAALTAKNYANLPEVKDRIKDRERREKSREELLIRKEKVKEMDKKLRDKKKRDKSNV